MLECGIKLLLVVFVGLNNLLGCYVLCFVYGNGEYFIYGISVLDSVGLCVSLGCICMNVLDIKVLFFSVWMGMLVKVINELVKYFVEFNGMCYVEVRLVDWLVECILVYYVGIDEGVSEVFYVVGEKRLYWCVSRICDIGYILFFCLLICYVWLFDCGEWKWFMNGVEIFWKMSGRYLIGK